LAKRWKAPVMSKSGVEQPLDGQAVHDGHEKRGVAV
jgi:hypothetical protein